MKKFWKREGKSIGISFCLTVVIAFVFYNSIYASVLFPIIYFFVRKVIKKEEQKRERMILKDEFREMILSMAAALEGGNSVEKALGDVEEEMKLLYGEESRIVFEVNQMMKKMEANHTVEKAFWEAASSMDLEEAKSFAENFKIGKRIGGNMNQIIMDSVEIISEKIQTEKEIEQNLAGKKFEFRIMCLAPVAIIAYVRLSSPGYFDSLYHNLLGVGIMSCVILAIVGAYGVGRKLIRIEV